MDVGCMQISFKWHSDNFASLEQAFDPVININYAADFEELFLFIQIEFSYQTLSLFRPKKEY